METKDLILRYGFAAGKRYTRRQKLRFLMGFTQDLEELGWKVEAKETQEKNLRNVNLYVGDLGKARVVAEAYYDTPPVSPLSGRYRFFSESYRKNELMLSVLTPLLLILAAGAIFFWKASAALYTPNGKISVAGVMNILVFLVLLYLMYRCRRGVARKRNVVRNTSSLLAIYRLAEKERKNKRLAMVLADNGCGSCLGAKVLKDKKGWNQTVVHLDCVGAREQLYLLYDSQNQKEERLKQIQELCAENEIKMLDLREKEAWAQDGCESEDFYLVPGTPDKGGFFLERKRLLDVELSEENLRKTGAFLAGLEKIMR